MDKSSNKNNLHKKNFNSFYHKNSENGHKFFFCYLDLIDVRPARIVIIDGSWELDIGVFFLQPEVE